VHLAVALGAEAAEREIHHGATTTVSDVFEINHRCLGQQRFSGGSPARINSVRSNGSIRFRRRRRPALG